MTLQPKDCKGRPIQVGSRVRLLKLSGEWLEDLSTDEKHDVLSMIGDVFEVEEIDEYGHAWIRKSWSDGGEGTYHDHSIALEPEEIELVDDAFSRIL